MRNQAIAFVALAIFPHLRGRAEEGAIRDASAPQCKLPVAGNRELVAIDGRLSLAAIGDLPEQQAAAAGRVRKVDANEHDEAEPLATVVSCKGLDAIGCMMKCAEAGASCAGKYPHPYKKEAGSGDLYQCKTGSPTHTCSYYYTNGDECAVVSPFTRAPLCVYLGAKPL